MNSPSEFAERIRAMIQREGDLVNHRMTWFLASQSILFAGLGLAWDKDVKFSIMIAVIGLAVCGSIHVSAQAGSSPEEKGEYAARGIRPDSSRPAFRISEERGRDRGNLGEGRISKRMQRDATAVSIVRGGRRFVSFFGRQQLAHGAPLMRMPICGLVKRMRA
jgi:hypothetical protein